MAALSTTVRVLLAGFAAVVLAAPAQAQLEARDDRGVAVRLAAPPHRIVSLLPSATESVCALGACERLVGTDRFSNWPASVRALPKLGGLFSLLGADLGGAPLNVSIFLALVAGVAVYYLIWRTKLGYEIRTVGLNPTAAIYAGISVYRITVVTMLISGALAGMMALNPVMGSSARLQVEFVGGAGFVGIAVSLMGRNHPLGIIVAAILFGILYQGGDWISFEMPNITREMILVIQGLVILFAGALEYMFRPAMVRLYQQFKRG